MAAERAVLRCVLDASDQLRPDPTRQTQRIYLNGLDWDVALSSNVWFDPTTKAVLRKPAFMDPEWLQSNTGLYQKLTVGGGATYGYTLTTSSKWKNFDASSQGGHYFASSQDVNEAVVSTYTWEVYQPFYIAWFVHAKETPAEEGTRLECGWGDPAGDVPTSLRIYPSGRVQVYRHDEQVYDGDGWTQADVAPQKTKNGSTGIDTQGTFAGYWIEPFERGILITCTSHGKSVLVPFEDWEEAASIPSAQFWWWVRAASGATTNPQATVQSAPVQFLAVPYVVSDVITLDELPSVEVTPVFSYIGSPGLVPTYELLDDTGSAAWDGVALTLRVKVYLDTSPVYSGALYSVEIEWPGESVRMGGDDALDLNELEQDDEEDAGSFALVSLSIRKADQVGGASARLEVRNPQRIDDAQDAQNVRTMTNRALSIQWGRSSIEGKVIDGRTGPPSVTYSLTDEAEMLAWDIGDQRTALEKFRFRSRKNFGGMTIDEALRWLFKCAGTFRDEDLDLEVSTFTLPTDDAGGDDASCVARVGDTAAEWIDRIMDDYSPLDFCDIVPRADRVMAVYRTRYVAGGA